MSRIELLDQRYPLLHIPIEQNDLNRASNIECLRIEFLEQRYLLLHIPIQQNVLNRASKIEYLLRIKRLEQSY